MDLGGRAEAKIKHFKNMVMFHDIKLMWKKCRPKCKLIL